MAQSEDIWKSCNPKFPAALLERLDIPWFIDELSERENRFRERLEKRREEE